MSTTFVDERPSDAAPPREWWQVWAQRRAGWWAVRPVLAARWARVRAVGLWVALVWVLGLVVLLPELRLGVRAYLGCVWVVVAWWLLARTKTLTWSGFMRFFAACVPWSIGIGVLSMLLSALAGEAVIATGPSVVIAGVVEETLKLVPIVLVVLLAPRRAGRFAAMDWALLGIASGTAFLAVEETARRVSLLVLDDLGAIVARAYTGSTDVPQDWVRFGLVPVPTSMSEGPAGFGGHAVMTAIVTGLVGLGIAAWRAVRGRGGLAALAVRAGAVGVPVLALVSAVADHAGLNVQSTDPRSATSDGTPLWLDPGESTIPWWIRVPWSWAGHGHGRPVLFVLVVVACLLLDAARLGRLPGANLRAVPAPRWVQDSAVVLRRFGTRWPVHAVGAVLNSAAALVWLTGRDLAEQVAAHDRASGQRRLDTARQAAVVPSAQRAVREAAFDVLSAPVRVGVRRVVAAGALVLLLLAALVVAPRTAQGVGPLPYDWWVWLAGVLDSLGNWWHGQPLGTQIAIGVGIAALVALSGGSLAFAFGVAGALTWGLDKSHGIATFMRDPDQATTDYLITTTPAQLAGDTLGVALTFGPGAFGGAVLGRGVRTVVDDVVADPAAWTASRRALLHHVPDSGTARIPVVSVRRPGDPASLGWASTLDYRTTFARAHPDIDMSTVIVHHAVEQQAMRRYRGLFDRYEIHSIENLRGIPAHLNRDIHLVRVRELWDDFYDGFAEAGRQPTRAEVLDYTTKVDDLLGHHFIPRER